MKCVTRPRITELNPHLLCVLCGGYYIDATAIIECLHSFCKSCIVRYLDTHKYCPICDVLVHKTKPLQNLRPDTILQNLVYKLVPNLYDREMYFRRNYYLRVHPSRWPSSSEERGEITESSSFYSSSDIICFSLEYVSYFEEQHNFYVAPSSTRYFRSQAAVTINHLQKLISAKYSLSQNNEVHLFYNEIQLPEYLCLLDLAYISSWKRKGYIRVLYQILEVKKVISTKEDENTVCTVTIPKPIVPSNIPALKPIVISDTETKPEHSFEPSTSSTTTTTTIISECITEVPNTTTSNSIATVIATTATTPCTNNLVDCVTTSCSIITTEPKLVCSVSAPLTTASCYEVKADRVVDNSVSPSTSSVSVPKTKENHLDNDTDTLGQKLEPTEQRVEANGGPVTNDTKTSSLEQNPRTECELSTSTKRKIKLGNEKSTLSAMINCSEPSKTYCTPPKMPKLELIRVEPNETEKKPKCDTVPAIRSIPKLQKIVTTASSLSVNIPRLHKIVTTAASGPSISVTSSSQSSTSQQNSINVATSVSCVQKSAPRPIYIRSEPSIMKSANRTVKTYTWPWNAAPDSSNFIDKERKKNVRVMKSKSTGNSNPGLKPLFITPPTMIPAAKPEDMKKSLKNLSVTKIDPKTLSPLPASTSGNGLPVSNVSSNSFPFLLSKNSLNPSSLATYTTSSNLGPSKSASSYLYPTLPMDPRRLYPPHALESLGHMMAVSNLNLCASQLFASSLHPSLSTLYGPPPAKNKTDKIRGKSGGGSSSSKTPPPAIQRIPIPPLCYEKLGTEPTGERRTQGSEREAISNGQLKNTSKNKKSLETSQFSINNLIPLDDVKHVSHSCSADGINQICDQVPPGQNKGCGIKEEAKELENKEKEKKNL